MSYNVSEIFLNLFNIFLYGALLCKSFSYDVISYKWSLYLVKCMINGKLVLFGKMTNQQKFHFSSKLFLISLEHFVFIILQYSYKNQHILD